MDLDIQKPEHRRKMLEDILPEQAAQHHALLRQIFRLEMDYREHDEDLAFYENIYWCGYLLFMVGDPSDVRMLWQGKHVNMDTGIGFDIHSLFGAGYDETVAYLKANRMHDILGELDSYADDLSWLGRWPEYMRDRFYASKP